MAVLDKIQFLVSFDETSGNAKDEVHNIRSVALTGTCIRVAGKYGNALAPQAASDKAVCTDITSLTADPVSVSIWVKISKLPSAMWGSYPRQLATFGSPASGGYFLSILSGDTVSFGIVDLAGSVYSASFDLVSGDVGTWVHICGVHTRSRVYIYKNGVAQNDVAADGYIKYNPAFSLNIGENFEGAIDEVAIFKDSLTQPEVATITAGQIIYPTPPLTSPTLLDKIRMLVNFDEASGPARNEAQDLRTFALEGTATRVAGKYGLALRTLAAADRAICTDTVSLHADPVSVSAWIKIDKLPSAMWGGYPKIIFGYGSPTTGGFFLGSRSGDNLSFYIVDSALSRYETSFALTSGDLGKWIHICGVHTRTRVYIYKDGVSMNDALSDGTIKWLPSDPAIIGENFEGAIDEVAVFGDSLTAGEVVKVFGGKILLAPSDGGATAAGDNAYQFTLGFMGDLESRSTETDQLRLYFDLSSVEDSSLFGRDGTAYGTPTYENRAAGKAIVFANPAGLTAATQLVTFPSCGTLTATTSASIRFKLKTSDASRANGRLFATDGFDNSDTESGISFTYNSPDSPNLVCRVSDGTSHVDLSGGLVTDGTWKDIALFLDRINNLALLSVNGTLVTSVSIASLGTISLQAPVLGATAVPGSSFGSLGARGAIAAVDDVTVVTVPVGSRDDTRLPLFPSTAFDSGAIAAGDLAGAAVPYEVPRDPDPRWSSLSLSSAETLLAEIKRDATDVLAATTYWEVEVSAPRAYLRVDAEYNASCPSTADEEISLTLPKIPRLNLKGLRIRYVIERYSDKSIYWATDWMHIPGEGDDGGGEPGPEPEGFEDLVVVHIFDYNENQSYTVQRMPNVSDPSSAVDHTWNPVVMKGLDLGPALVNNKARQLVLETIRPGRFRYRLTTVWPDGDTFSQDFLLLVWPKAGEQV